MIYRLVDTEVRASYAPHTIDGMAANRAGTQRPGPLRWLYYAYGGGLGPAYAQWVLHDLTCRTWFVRHLTRTLAQAAPAFLALFLPGSISWLIFIPLLVVFGALYISVAFAWETRDHRLYKHGFVPEMVLPRGDDDDLDDE